MAARQHRLLAGSLIGGVVVLAVAMWFALGATDGALARPPLPLLVGVPVLGLVLHVVLDAVGYRTAALPRGTGSRDATNLSLARYQSLVVVRFALAEAVAIVCLAAGFVVPHGGYSVVLLGCATTLLLLRVHVWPWHRPVDRTAAALEADGVRSGLREALGFRSDAVVREL